MIFLKAESYSFFFLCESILKALNFFPPKVSGCLCKLQEQELQFCGPHYSENITVNWINVLKLPGNSPLSYPLHKLLIDGKILPESLLSG